MENITLKMQIVDHHTVVLYNDNGDTFTFNPQTRNGEPLMDFLMLTK